MTTPLDVALAYCRRRWNPVPLPYRKKKPVDDAWQLRVITESNAVNFFNSTAQNIGVILGPSSQGLTDIDLDCPEAIRIAPYVLPKTSAKFGRPSKPDSHWLYYTTLGQTLTQASIPLRDPRLERKNMLLEVRFGGGGRGAQTVFPGSVHEEGEQITWAENGEPATVDDDELLRLAHLVAALSLLARYWPGEGARHDAALTVGGFLARCGLKPPYVKLYVEAVARAAHDEEVRDRTRAAEDAAVSYQQDKPTRGFPELKRTFGEVASKVADLLDYRVQPEPDPPPDPPPEPQPHEQPLFDPWERYITPEFPLHVLPLDVQDYVRTQSVVIGCDPSALAMAALTAFSGALDHRFAVKMMRSGNWWEHPRLWTLLVGDPSRKKTPIINEVTWSLEQHQNALRRSYERALAVYEEAKESGDNSVRKPNPPVRYVVWDSTPEKLGDILSRSEHGLLVKRDEFSGWIGGMEKYSSSRAAGADRGFWLQAFDGGPHAVDRIGRGETYIGNLSVSLIGGIQPAKLAEIQGLTSDGLLQRFVPVMMRASSFARDYESNDERAKYHSLVSKLIVAPHRQLFLSERALALMNELREHLHKLEQVAAGRADGLQAFVGKLSGIAGRLAVILHMAANPENAPREVAAMTVTYVDDLIRDFILPHAVEFYRAHEELTGGERLRKVASWILTSQQTEIASRDLIRNVSCLRGVSVLDLHTYLSPLVAAGWLEPMAPGPLNRVWAVNPGVAEQFEQQRQIEEQRKLCAAELMGSPRRVPEG